jgi:hypothetical protein
MDLVTIATFDTVEEAYLARNRLATDGIRSFIEEGSMASLMPHNPAFAAKLQVAQDSADQARHILREIDREKFE